MFVASSEAFNSFEEDKILQSFIQKEKTFKENNSKLLEILFVCRFIGFSQAFNSSQKGNILQSFIKKKTTFKENNSEEERFFVKVGNAYYKTEWAVSVNGI